MTTRVPKTSSNVKVSNPSITDLLAAPDPRLVIGAHIPIPYQYDVNIPYPEVNIFQEDGKGEVDQLARWCGFGDESFCFYCEKSFKKLNDHLKSEGCKKVQGEFKRLPSLLNSRSCLDPSVLGMGFPVTQEGWEIGSAQNDNDWGVQLGRLKGVTKYGFQVHFSFSDILNSYPVIRASEHPLSNHFVLQSCTGTFLEAILLLVSYYNP